MKEAFLGMIGGVEIFAKIEAKNDKEFESIRQSIGQYLEESRAAYLGLKKRDEN